MLKNRWTYRIFFVVCLLPLVYLAWKWGQIRINRLEYVARYTGDWTIRFLLASLAITPLRRIPGLNSLILYRKSLGLFAFFYGLLHGLHYYQMDVQWDWSVIREDLTIRRFFIAGMAALLLMLPLALTSSNWAIRKMGGKRWQALHRLAYLAGIAGVTHYLWQGKSINYDPLIYAVLLAVLLGIRVVFYFRKRARTMTAAG